MKKLSTHVIRNLSNVSCRKEVVIQFLSLGFVASKDAGPMPEHSATEGYRYSYGSSL
jgi:hypothetical protein